MAKEAGNANFLPDLFQGLDELPPANRKTVQSNTLDRDLINVTSGSTPEVEGAGVRFAELWDLDDLQDMEECVWN
jgi:hypothetical protein